MKEKRIKSFVAVASLGLTTALSSIGISQTIPASPTNETGTPQPKVEGRLLTSSRMPALKLKVGRDFRYVGTQSFILYGRAQAEQHFFVDADKRGRIRRLIWIQFEGFLPEHVGSYSYPESKSVNLGGLDFIAETSVLNIKTDLGPPNSDGNRARTFLESQGFRMATDEVISQRFVHLIDEKKRNELMIIYSEDLSLIGMTPSDLKKDGRLDMVSSELQQRAVNSLTILR